MNLRGRAFGLTRMCSLALSVCCGLLAGCAINPPARLSEMTSEATSLEAVVPFYPQSEYQCGPAALAGLLGAAGVRVLPEALTPQVYLPERHGSLQIELLAATRRAGRLAYTLDGDLEALIAEIHSGRPVLVLQNLLTPHVPRWHYAVLIGMDPAGNRVILNSGIEQGMTMAAGKFLRTWDWGGRWAMVALRPGELPVRADPARYAEAVAAFETVGDPEAAAQAWIAATRRWPSDDRPYLGLGNLAYNSGDRNTAVNYFRRGLALDPQAPAVANNLATVLGELGCPRSAEALLRRIVEGLSDESQWQPALTATLAELRSKPGPDADDCATYGNETLQHDSKAVQRAAPQ